MTYQYQITDRLLEVYEQAIREHKGDFAITAYFLNLTFILLYSENERPRQIKTAQDMQLFIRAVSNYKRAQQ